MEKIQLAENPWEQVIAKLDTFAAAETEWQLQYLCQFGLLAPTSHNSVPQRYRILAKGQMIELIMDRKFVLPFSDRVGRQAIISMGCVIESITLVAGWYGWNTEVSYLTVEPQSLFPHVAGQQRYVPVVQLSFAQMTTKEEQPNWPKLLLERKVIRAEYDRTETLPEELQQRMSTTLTELFPNVQMHLLTGTLSLRALGKFQENADRFVMENRQFAQELGEWLLPNTEQTSTHAMRGVEFGLDDAFSQIIHEGLQGKRRLLPDQIASFAKGGKVGVESSAAVAVLTVAKDDMASRMEAGRAYLHATLLAWEAGFANAVHAGITEVDWVTTMFAASVLRTSRRPEVVFRIGKPKREADWKRPHAKRPGLEKLLTVSK